MSLGNYKKVSQPRIVCQMEKLDFSFKGNVKDLIEICKTLRCEVNPAYGLGCFNGKLQDEV